MEANAFWNSEMETMPTVKMRTVQQERFLSICTSAYENTVFYRNKFNEASISIDAIKSIEDIGKLPFTHKSELRSSQQRMPPYGEHCAFPNQLCQTYWSTGTTGTPTFMSISAEESDYWVDVAARSLFSAGLRKGDTFHHATQLSSFAGGYLFLQAAQRIGANIVPAGAGNTNRHIKLISTLKPTFIKILPSYAHYLATYAKDSGIDMAKCSVKSIYLSAEPSSSVLRKRIENEWNAITFDNYGLSDLGQPEAYECNCRDGLHVVDDWVLTEIVDPITKQPIQEAGKEGVLVYTNLVRKTMPIIRFWTDNPTSWHNETSCRCGRTCRKISPIYRRLDNTVKVKGINLWPDMVGKVLEEENIDVSRHRTYVNNYGGKDHVTIMLELNAIGTLDEVNALKERIKEKFQAACFIKADEVEVLPPRSFEEGEHKEEVLIDLREKI